MIGDVVDRDLFVFDAVIKFLEMQRRVGSQLHQRNLMRLLLVGRHKSRPAGPIFVSMEIENLFIPLLRALGVAHEDIQMPEILRPGAQFLSSA